MHRVGAVDKAGGQDVDFVRELEQIENLRVVGVNRDTGDEPMTGAQASYLKTLSEQAHKPETFEDGLTKAEASERIDQLKAWTVNGTDAL
jgi:hypothetical protein